MKDRKMENNTVTQELVEVVGDDRGFGYVFKVPLQFEFLVFEMMKGSFRGGDVHTADQITVCVSGLFTIKEMYPEGERNIILHEGKSHRIKAGIPHLFKSLEHSILMEWKMGRSKDTYFKPYLKIAEKGALV